MAIIRVWILAAFCVLLALSSIHHEAFATSEAAAEEMSAVLTLDASNFTEIVSKHPFIVVEFFAPWCGHCKSLAPEYEEAAKKLSESDPPIVLAKFDVTIETNKELAQKHEVQGIPTLKIFKDGGMSIADYKGPMYADGIIDYLKRLSGPVSVEIKSLDDVNNLAFDKKLYIVGIFPQFAGDEFQAFMEAAEKLRSDYNFHHTLDAKLLPHGDSTIRGPIVRLFKPFDELVLDFEDFDIDALEKFIESESMPTVATFDNEPINRPYLTKIFESTDTKVILFINFSSESFDGLKSKFHEVAKEYKGTNMSFVIANWDDAISGVKAFGLSLDQAPLIIIQQHNGKKYLQPNVQPEQIFTWLKEYKDGSLNPYKKSEPIPEVNNEPVRIVVADNAEEEVFKSGKNVLLEFYVPWCRACKSFAPILEEVAVSFENDKDVVIAKMDVSSNDIPEECKIYSVPTLYFSTPNGKLMQYNGNRTAEEIIDFVQNNREPTTQPDHSHDSVKDEL